MEHLREFGLSRDPFSNDPAQGFYYESPMHRSAERRVLRGATQRKGLCLLVGEPGAGKSLVARRVLDGLEEEAYEASLLVVLQSDVDAAWLLSRIARQLGVEDPSDDSHEALAQIYERLSICSEEGRRPVVIIDDAHLLASRERMEVLRALVELEYEEHQLLTLVLVGGPELDRAIATDPALPHRVDVRTVLEPLDLSTSAAYLGHRITAAGGHPSVLEPDAVEVLQRLGHGLPRRLNVLADNALFEAHLANRTRVVPADVERVARDLVLAGTGIVALADGLDVDGTPGGEPIELNDEIGPAETGSFADTLDSRDPVLSAFDEDDEPKDLPEATFFEQESPPFEHTSPPTMVIDPSDGGVDRDVDHLFDNLIDD